MTSDSEGHQRDGGGAQWFKSSYSGGNSCCVEVVFDSDVIRVRDSKYRRDPASGQDDEPILSFTEAEWAAFVAGVKAGEFDRGMPIP